MEYVDLGWMLSSLHHYLDSLFYIVLCWMLSDPKFLVWKKGYYISCYWLSSDFGFQFSENLWWLFVWNIWKIFCLSTSQFFISFLVRIGLCSMMCKFTKSATCVRHVQKLSSDFTNFILIYWSMKFQYF